MTLQLRNDAEYPEADATISQPINNVYLCVSNNSTIHFSPIIIMMFVELFFFSFSFLYFLSFTWMGLPSFVPKQRYHNTDTGFQMARKNTMKVHSCPVLLQYPQVHCFPIPIFSRRCSCGIRYAVIRSWVSIRIQKFRAYVAPSRAFRNLKTITPRCPETSESDYPVTCRHNQEERNH